MVFTLTKQISELIKLLAFPKRQIALPLHPHTALPQCHSIEHSATIYAWYTIRLCLIGETLRIRVGLKHVVSNDSLSC